MNLPRVMSQVERWLKVASATLEAFNKALAITQPFDITPDQNGIPPRDSTGQQNGPDGIGNSQPGNAE